MIPFWTSFVVRTYGIYDVIADNGPRQQVLFFSRSNGRYAESGSLGERGGIFSGTPGKPGPQRFNGLTIPENIRSVCLIPCSKWTAVSSQQPPWSN